MIVTIDELREDNKFDNFTDEVLTRKLTAIESAIRAFTNNNFQNVRIRFAAESLGGVLNDTSVYLSENDTVQVTKSINEGLYIVEATNGVTVLNMPLLDSKYNLVTKVEYPPDVIEGVKSLLLWEVTQRDKAGIKSESISRHSVTYGDVDSITGYPKSMLGFLYPYRKAQT